ncbi:probable glutamate receptor [Argiope bruennichi]|uniref:probable glutamate receptor n=1 Tax=Argiope bruennichi TaxID=94029 RepID=UPI0024949273|nr:probable glutamate receptor [Argiope bruennichi]
MNCPPGLRVATTPARNLIIQKNDNGNMTFGGTDGIFLEIILKALHQKFKLVISPDNELGRLLPNGSWTGMIGLIERGEADIAYNCLAITEGRAKVVDFSVAYDTDQVIFAIKKLGTFTTPMSFIYPFDSAVWISTLLTLMIMPIAFRVVSQVQETYFHLFIKLLGAILGKSLDLNEDSWKCRILIYSWSIFSFIMAFSYTAVFFAILSVPSEIPNVKNFEELSNAVSKRGFKVVTAKGSAAHYLLLHSEKEHLRLIGEAIYRNNWYIDPRTPLFESTKIDIDSAHIGLKSKLQMIAGPEERKHHFLSDDSLTILPMAVAMKKNFCLARKLNTIIYRLSSAGLYRKILSDDHFRKWLAFSEKQRVVHHKIEPLSVKLLSVAFVILSCGLILGLMALIGEIIYQQNFKKL